MIRAALLNKDLKRVREVAEQSSDKRAQKRKQPMPRVKAVADLACG